jgi:hypothetical protein
MAGRDGGEGRRGWRDLVLTRSAEPWLIIRKLATQPKIKFSGSKVGVAIQLLTMVLHSCLHSWFNTGPLSIHFNPLHSLWPPSPPSLPIMHSSLFPFWQGI